MLELDISQTRIKSYASLKEKLEKIRKQPMPSFEGFREDLKLVDDAVKKYKKYKNVIIIGNGGSNTSFCAFHQALVPMNYRRKMFILTTMEPDLVDELKSVFPRRNTLVMPISKSGTTIGVIESMLAFPGYQMLPVTSPKEGAISLIAKEKGFDIIPHPSVGGRFSGLTASAFAPAALFDIDIHGIENGARRMYSLCNPGISIEKNPALQLAASLFLLEEKGYDEIFCPIYSSKLSGFRNLIVQLMHESVCKRRRGQTIYCADAPESQHHTNQRFFGGRRNVAGLFITVKSQNHAASKVAVPDTIKKIKLRGGELGSINNVPYGKALEFEFEGTYRDAVNNRIPCARVSLDKVSAFSVGEFLGFWHYVAVYSALLRDVDPFDQPQVESSKDISFELRKKHHF